MGFLLCLVWSQLLLGLLEAGLLLGAGAAACRPEPWPELLLGGWTSWLEAGTPDWRLERCAAGGTVYEAVAHTSVDDV